MSIIVHRCSCGHPDIYHQHRDNPGAGHCSYGTCVLRTHEYGAPEVIPTFVDGKVNDYLFEPGDTASGYNLCSCEDCRALYEAEKVAVDRRFAWHASA